MHLVTIDFTTPDHWTLRRYEGRHFLEDAHIAHESIAQATPQLIRTEIELFRSDGK